MGLRALRHHVGRAALCFWLAALPCLPQELVPSREATESALKAAFLLNFVKFVEWPDPANGVEPGEFAICILGDDPFGLTLDELVAGERVRGRPVVVRRIRRLVNGCQTLFVSSSERDVFRTLRRTGPGVLTVGDEAGFLSDGGMINFVPDGRRLRFDVNPAAAQASGLKISSRLLAVARTVLP